MLKGKNAIVTGANRGIGRATLECLARHGANVWACARTETDEFIETCQNIAGKYQVLVTPVCFDLGDESAMKTALREIKFSKRSIDILVNNAGVIPENRLFQMASMEEAGRVMNINFFSAMQLVQTVSKTMMRQKSGAIVNICSIAALDGEPGQFAYVASKSAMAGATKKLASELGVYGIRVNAVAPGVIDTDMAKNMSDDLRKKTEERTVMKRLGRPEEIANVVLFLSSELSSYMTGQILRADGGII